jgi:hypothetical protein
MSAPSVLKVFIRNLVGEYLCRDGKQWCFTTDPTKAHIFDYRADKVAEQLELARRESGAIWVAVQVDAPDGAETCDGCGRKLRSTDIQFDGTRYLCPDCRKPNDTSPWP